MFNATNLLLITAARSFSKSQTCRVRVLQVGAKNWVRPSPSLDSGPMREDFLTTTGTHKEFVSSLEVSCVEITLRIFETTPKSSYGQL